MDYFSQIVREDMAAAYGPDELFVWVKAQAEEARAFLGEILNWEHEVQLTLGI